MGLESSSSGKAREGVPEATSAERKLVGKKVVSWPKMVERHELHLASE